MFGWRKRIGYIGPTVMEVTAGWGRALYSGSEKKERFRING